MAKLIPMNIEFSIQFVLIDTPVAPNYFKVVQAISLQKYVLTLAKKYSVGFSGFLGSQFSVTICVA